MSDLPRRGVGSEVAADDVAPSVVEQILDAARWAPSGDNTQPWRFEIVSDTHVVVHAFDTRDTCVYDLEGHASQVSVGALLETMQIAASAHGRSMQAKRRADSPAARPVIDVALRASEKIVADPLHRVVRERSVQRKALSTRPLPDAMKSQLEQAVGPAYTVLWFESARARAAMSWLAVQSAKIRLTIPEAYAVHRDIIEWNARYSVDRVPDAALGADPMLLRSMRWIMGSWSRVSTMNRYFGGTYLPRLQLDLLPGLRCGAHFAICASSGPRQVDHYLEAGRALQRFWLTAASLGLQLQPQYTPLVFAEYARSGLAFTEQPAALARAHAVAEALDRTLGRSAASAVFMGRLGFGSPPEARSTRKPLAQLMWNGKLTPDRNFLPTDAHLERSRSSEDGRP